MISITVTLHVYVRDFRSTMSQMDVLHWQHAAFKSTQRLYYNTQTRLHTNVLSATGHVSGPTRHIGMVRQVGRLSVPPSVYTTSPGLVSFIIALYLSTCWHTHLSFLCYFVTIAHCLWSCRSVACFSHATNLDSPNKHKNTHWVT